MSVLGGVIRMVRGMRPIMSCFTRNCGCSHGGQDTWDVRSWLGNPDGLCDENIFVPCFTRNRGCSHDGNLFLA